MNEQLRIDLREAYAPRAQERDRAERQTWKAEEQRRCLRMLQQEQKRSLLEHGAGPGRDGKFFQDSGLEVVCTDLSPQMVGLCREKGLTAQVMDVADLRFPPASFDAVYSMNCLLHVPKNELPTVLQGIATVLKPDGLFFMGVYGGTEHEGPWIEDVYEPKRYFSFYTDEQLQEVVTRYFKGVSFRRVVLDDDPRTPHFQSLVLRAPSGIQPAPSARDGAI